MLTLLRVPPTCHKILNQGQFSTSLMEILNSGRLTMGNRQMVGRVHLPLLEKMNILK